MARLSTHDSRAAAGTVPVLPIDGEASRYLAESLLAVRSSKHRQKEHWQARGTKSRWAGVARPIRR